MRVIDRTVSFVGKAVSWLTLVLVLVIVIDVILRYAFSITSAASFEMEWHLFAAIFLLGAGYTLQQDKHVRVDVFYSKFSTKTKAWINLCGGCILLIPFCIVGFWESLSFVYSSFRIDETSPQPGGLPARWIIKAVIPLSFVILGLQCVSIIGKSLKTVKYGEGKEIQ